MMVSMDAAGTQPINRGPVQNPEQFTAMDRKLRPFVAGLEAARPHDGYSVRGLHALLSAMLERYREMRDPDFAARSPRDLLA